MNVEVTSFINGCPNGCSHRGFQTEVGEVSRADGSLVLLHVVVDCIHSDVCKLKKGGDEAVIARCQSGCARSKSTEVS